MRSGSGRLTDEASIRIGVGGWRRFTPFRIPTIDSLLLVRFGSFHLRMHPSLVFVRWCCLRNVGTSWGRADSTARQTSERNRKSAVRSASSAGSRRIGNGQRGKHDPLACKVHVRQARAVAAGRSGTAIAVAGRRCGVRALTGAIARFVRRITLICSRHRLRLRLQSAFVQSKLLFYHRNDAETLVDGAG